MGTFVLLIPSQVAMWTCQQCLDLVSANEDAVDRKLSKYASLSDSFVAASVAVRTFGIIDLRTITLLQKIGKSRMADAMHFAVHCSW